MKESIIIIGANGQIGTELAIALQKIWCRECCNH